MKFEKLHKLIEATNPKRKHHGKMTITRGKNEDGDIIYYCKFISGVLTRRALIKLLGMRKMKRPNFDSGIGP